MTAPRGIELGVIVALAVAAVGLVSGVESSGRTVASYVEDRPAPHDAPVAARSYRDMRARATGPNAELSEVWWQSIRVPTDPFTVAPSTAGDREAAVARRAERRAFDGAPPMVPHAVDQLATPACLSCHDRGVAIAGVVAPRMSHERHDNCLQCHVVAHDPRRGAVTPPEPATTFVGLVPHRGDRAWRDAPPTIPHPTRMRERCDSCHGSRGVLGVRSPHPWRSSCTQCHAPSAVLDQRAPRAIRRTP